MSTQLSARVPSWVGLVAPLLVVVLMFGVELVSRFDTYHGNVTGFVLFGTDFTRATVPPSGALALSPQGYDGQFFYLQAKDPLLLDDSTLRAVRDEKPLTGPGFAQPFRLARVGYPALADLLAGGETSAIPWTMLLLNLLVCASVTLGFALLARRLDHSPLWALAIGLNPGFLTGTLRDLSDPLATAALLAALILWRQRRYYGAAAMMTLSVLTRETMTLALIGFAGELVVGWYRRPRDDPERRSLRVAWPVLVIPIVAFAAWGAYFRLRYGGSLSSVGGDATSLTLLAPLGQAIRLADSDPYLRNQVWELTFLGLMVAGIAVSLVAVWRRASASAITAAVFGLSLVLVTPLADVWSYTRLAMPMFAALLLSTLEFRWRVSMVLCAAVAALTLVAPFAQWIGAA